MNLGTENKKKTIWAAVLGVAAIIAFVYGILPILIGPSAPPVAASQPGPTSAPQSAARRGAGSGKAAKKILSAENNLDPTLRLQLLAATEQTKYEGSGRNIFVAQAEPPPTPVSNGTTDHAKQAVQIYVPPTPQPPPPIPLKFFGFANKPGEAKKIFLSKEQDVFIAGEGEIVDRRYRVMRISPTAVEIQDLVVSGPPQSIPLTQNL